MSRTIRILAVAALIVLGVATAIKAKAGPVIVTASPLVTESPIVKVRHAPRIEREHEKPEAAKPAPRALTPWSLPISCSKAKWYMTHFSESTLDKMRIAAGIDPPTPLQKQQGRECLKGLRPND